MKRENQKIILVTGKGGVGKTTVAAAIALARARLGLKVLLVELGEKSFLRHVFPQFDGDHCAVVTENLWVDRWEGEACLREYLHHYLRLETVVNLFFDNRVMKALVGAAPALRELAVLGKITSGPRGIGPDLPYDCIVVDAYATGHFRALLQAPVGMAEVIKFGPMGEQSRSMLAVLRDDRLTQAVIVSLPEELPVHEACELNSYLHETMQVATRIVLNKNLAMPLSAEELVATRQKLETLAARPDEALEFLSFLAEQGGRQEDAAASLRKMKRPMVELPLYFQTGWPELLRAMCLDVEKA